MTHGTKSRVTMRLPLVDLQTFTKNYPSKNSRSSAIAKRVAFLKFDLENEGQGH